jgi:hypothetical protein
MSTLYRGPSIDASYQVSVHLAKRFQRRRFLKIGQSENESKLGRKHHWKVLYKDCSFSSDPLTNMATIPSFDSFGQAVSEKIFYKSTNQKQELPLVAIFVDGMGRNEETL